MKNHSKILVFLLILAVFGITTPVYAESGVFSDMVEGLETFNKEAGLPKSDLNTMAATIIKSVLSFLGIFALIIVMYGGFLWMVSGSNEDRKKAAKGTFVNGIIGLIIILLAYTIVSYVFGMFEGAIISTE